MTETAATVIAEAAPQLRALRDRLKAVGQVRPAAYIGRALSCIERYERAAFKRDMDAYHAQRRDDEAINEYLDGRERIIIERREK